MHTEKKCRSLEEITAHGPLAVRQNRYSIAREIQTAAEASTKQEGQSKYVKNVISLDTEGGKYKHGYFGVLTNDAGEHGWICIQTCRE
jgi:hypothetical protein